MRMFFKPALKLGQIRTSLYSPPKKWGQRKVENVGRLEPEELPILSRWSNLGAGASAKGQHLRVETFQLFTAQLSIRTNMIGYHCLKVFGLVRPEDRAALACTEDRATAAVTLRLPKIVDRWQRVSALHQFPKTLRSVDSRNNASSPLNFGSGSELTFC